MSEISKLDNNLVIKKVDREANAIEVIIIKSLVPTDSSWINNFSEKIKKDQW